jgi:large subunit ribosomal protein L10
VALNLADKEAIVQQLSGNLDGALCVVAADYCGLSVSAMDELRVKARAVDVKVGVYRNTLARRAIADTDFACLTDTLVGPIVLLFSYEAPGAAARILRDFIKSNDKLEVRGLALDGKLLGPDQLPAVASLPTRDEALAILLSLMKAPVTKLVRTLNEPAAQMVRVTAAVRDQKQ